MIFGRMPEAQRIVTKNRLRHAERFLARERTRFALFADEVAADQPTAEERIASFDAGQELVQQEWRVKRAADWRKARQRFHDLPVEQRQAVDAMWRRRTYPLDPLYLIALIGRIRTGELDPVKEEADLARLRELGRQHRIRAASSLATA